VTAAFAAPAPTRWCGAGGAAADLPDAVSNIYEVHVIYAVPSDAPDRFAQLALPIAQDLAAIDGWWQTQDSTRTIRFDFATFAGCDTQFGQLDLSDVRLPHDSSYYADESDRYDRLRVDLVNPFSDPNKKYLVYFDGPVNNRQFCGSSVTGVPGPLTASQAKSNDFAYAEVYIPSFCGSDLGGAGTAAIAAVHELIHNFGALAQPLTGARPPNACPTDRGHPCDSPSDILYPSTGAGQTLSQEQLDVGRDDYYDHHRPWFDVRTSLFLIHLDDAARAPLLAAATLTATNAASAVTVTWGAATGDDALPTSYRVYRDGTLLTTTFEVKAVDAAAPGSTVVYSIQPFDGLGNIGASQTVRFTVGLGIVDASGKLLRDTVPPPAVVGLRSHQKGKQLVISWTPVSDLGGLLGYRVTQNGKQVGALVRGTSLQVAISRARGRWIVRAVDRAGNVGALSEALAVSGVSR
jgi:hypothetical protein